MKLSAYIALLESIRVAKGGDIDVFVAQGNGLSGQGLAGTREPAAAAVVDTISHDGDVVLIVDRGRFDKRFGSNYEQAGKCVQLG
jgi:aspartate aminotransferase-like enzyme